MKRIISVSLIVVLCLILCCTPVFGMSKISDKTDLSSLRSKEDLAVQKYNDLLKEWSENKVYYSDSDAEYPVNYGGAYINENKDLVIQLTNIDADTQAYYSKIIDLENVKFEKVDQSVYELREIKDRILKEVKIGEGNGIAGIVIATKDNAVAVYTVVNDADASTYTVTNEVRKVAGISDDVKYVPAAGYDSMCATVQPGTEINGLGTSRSIGFWAKDSNGNLGIVTAPHSTITVGTTMSIGGTTFGIAQTPANSGTVDAVFVKRTNTSFLPSRYISGLNCSIKSQSYITLPVGASTRSKGMTSGCQYGTVVDINYTTTYGISDTILTTAPSQSGDSGGIVINDGELDCLVGIITGHQGSTGYQICIKAKNIFDRLNVTVY